MLDISQNTYIFTLYPLMIISIITILAITRFLRSGEYPVEINSLQIFRVYFVCGLLGWIGLWLQELGIMEPNLYKSVFFYLLCGLLLFLIAHDYSDNKLPKIIITTIHLSLLVTIFLLETQYELMVILSWYIFLMYPLFTYFFIKKAIIYKNLGHLVISFAGMIVSLMAVMQLHDLYTTGDTSTAYQLAFTAGTIGYVLVGIGFLTSLLINEHQKLLNMALNDPLTGVLNRRGLNHALTTILEMNKRKQTCLSVLAIDLDHFKAVNDEFGHDGGDQVLRCFAQNVCKIARKGDLLCRLGGEEFLLVMPETTLEGAKITAERIREKIEKRPIKFKNHKIKLTSSFGLMNQYGETDIDYLVKRADEALYQAKANGRNQVCISPLAE